MTNKPWQFQPGVSGNPNGRPRGRKRKLSDRFIAALMNDFDIYGKATIEAIRTARPIEYMRLVTSLMPRSVEIDRKALARTVVAAISNESRA